MARLSLYVVMFAATTTCQAGAMSIQEGIEQRVSAMAGLEMHELQAEIEHMSTTLRQNLSLETAVMSVSKHMNVTPAFASILQEWSIPHIALEVGITHSISSVWWRRVLGRLFQNMKGSIVPRP
jgi:hypothetical protein